jgi:hypothetical protein
VRFSTNDGVPLPFEIEHWDSAAMRAAIWVKVDVTGNGTQSLKLTWGDPGAPGQSDPNAVFSLDEGFTGVWHLSEPGSTTPGGYEDSTANEAHAVGVEMTPEGTGPGRIGNAVLLNHDLDQWLQVPLDKSVLYDEPEQMTYSIWFNANSHDVEYQCMFSKGEGGFRLHYVGLASYYGNKHITEPCVESTVNNDICPVDSGNGTDCAPGSWFHILAVHDHPNISFYVNGELEAMLSAGEAWESDASRMVMIGNNASSTGRSFDGFLDEARLMNVPKDENWIKLEYESQRDGQQFSTVEDP